MVTKRSGGWPGHGSVDEEWQLCIQWASAHEGSIPSPGTLIVQWMLEPAEAHLA
jgi:hypothetical protein